MDRITLAGLPAATQLPGIKWVPGERLGRLIFWVLIFCKWRRYEGPCEIREEPKLIRPVSPKITGMEKSIDMVPFLVQE